MEARTHPSAAGDAAALQGGHTTVAGRDAALAVVTSAVDGTGGSRIVLIEGEGGIGKSTLWGLGVRRARELGLPVFACRPAESEADLPFSGLADLLAALDDEELAALPEPQRLALGVALVRSAPAVGGTGRLAVAQALLTVLRRQPAGTLVAVDDLQWLDEPTTEALAYAARRLDETSVRLLLARRSGTPPPPWLARNSHVLRLEIGPLPVDALDRVVRAHLATRLARPRLVELHRVSRGNPYFALEIVRALRRDELRGSQRSLPVPESVTALLGGRLESLSAQARDAALVVAAAGQPTLARAEAATGGPRGLDEAVDRAVLELDGDRVRFSHPLLASAAYDAASPSARRDAHRRLVETAADTLERAHHLSLATDRPNASVAEELEAAAALAAARGAPSAAAALLDRAADLTPAGLADDRLRRRGDSAEQHYRAGDQRTSREILEALVGDLPPGPERARRLGELSQRVAYQGEGLELCRRALAEAGNDDALASDLHFQLAAAARRASTLAEAEEHARAAVVRAGAAGDTARSARALAMLGHVETMRAGTGRASLERAVELERSTSLSSLHFRPGFLLGITLLYLGELGEARTLIEEQVQLAAEAGDEVMRGVALSSLAELELRAGDWSKAYRCAEEGAALQRQAAPLQDQAHHVLREGRLLAHLGDLERARPLAAALLELAPANGDKGAEIAARRDLGFIELSAGNHAAAAAVLEPALALVVDLGARLFSAYPFVQDYVEAAAALPDLARAATANALLAGHGRPWEDAMHARGLALIRAGAGDVEGALAAVSEALEAHERLDAPFELARTLLVRGTIERRAKQRSDARRSLTEALDIFDALGAPHWSEKAAAELSRIPGRASGGGELTETERRVAELVRDGLSNKEVAARLFVTVRTVESNLSRVYAKLGIRSRTELAQHL